MEQDVELFFIFQPQFLEMPTQPTYSNEQNFREYFESIFAESLILKIPQPECRIVFEMIKIPRIGCQDILPKVIIPNVKIPNAQTTNAIIPSVAYNGSPNQTIRGN